jgi:hypothetical protein
LYLRVANEVECTEEDWFYKAMVTIAKIQLVNMLLLFYLLCKLVRLAFFWQIGTRVRDRLPSYVNIIDLSVIDMKGYVDSIRAHLSYRTFAVNTYHLHVDLMRRREVIDKIEFEVYERARMLKLHPNLMAKDEIHRALTAANAPREYKEL